MALNKLLIFSFLLSGLLLGGHSSLAAELEFDKKELAEAIRLSLLEAAAPVQAAVDGKERLFDAAVDGRIQDVMRILQNGDPSLEELALSCGKSTNPEINAMILGSLRKKLDNPETDVDEMDALLGSTEDEDAFVAISEAISDRDIADGSVDESLLGCFDAPPLDTPCDLAWLCSFIDEGIKAGRGNAQMPQSEFIRDIHHLCSKGPIKNKFKKFDSVMKRAKTVVSIAELEAACDLRVIKSPTGPTSLSLQRKLQRALCKRERDEKKRSLDQRLDAVFDPLSEPLSFPPL